MLKINPKQNKTQNHAIVEMWWVLAATNEKVVHKVVQSSWFTKLIYN